MIRRLTLTALLCLAAAACLADTGSYTEADFASVEKVDVHIHLYGEMPAFAARAKADGFRVLTINVN